ncbi:Similar to jockey\pol: RNA-directed DNA polymerase from mobile element jockey (Drosophila funebris) [Cotesia congregata]|uniref:Similar to jockey\pol: RNA-directed DNA polymerase from mobile element jockey (Drosophila funebris) n=1 Tax=Cotesia congregata TaxID=51543 RepID=A0A8J2MDS5_COTCN|nr:Similar to jockey\pol: RNA-directed DNA polymerase from mobile element jockey (Drosophila funebris) [Cotesia congregata]
MFGLFVDFKRAFDSVPHVLLWNKLFKAGISPKIFRILKILYDQAICQIRSGGMLSEKFEVTEGVLQGEILSPLLFILYLYDIVKYFREKKAKSIQINSNYDMIMLLYADDLVILSDSILNLRKNVNILEEYCGTHKLNINFSKTKIVHFKRGDPNEKTKIYCGNNLIEWTNEYEYLGVPITGSALGLSAANAACRKARLATGAALSSLAGLKARSWDGMLKIYKSCVQSSLLYAAPVWGLRYLEKLKQTHLMFFKRLLALTYGTPSAELRIELNLANSKLEVLKLSLNLVYQGPNEKSQSSLRRQSETWHEFKTFGVLVERSH